MAKCSYNRSVAFAVSVGKVRMCIENRGYYKMYKTVVFDLDGTLLNTLTDLADAGNRLCRKYGWPTHERQAYRYFVGNGIPKLVERLAPADQRTPAVLEAALADFKRDYGQHLRDTTAPYPGIPEMLAKLKANGVQLAVFSNKADALAKEVVKDYFGTQYFTIVRGQMTGVAPKPAAEGTNALLQALHADPASTLYVGDSNVDVETAHNANLPCCGAVWGFRTREELNAAGAEYLAENSDELYDVIMK